MSVAQILAILIFVVMFLLVVTEKFEKHIVTLVCGLATLILVFLVAMRSTTAVIDTLNFKSIFTLNFWYSVGSTEDASAGINWATIIFTLGMMIMVEGMAKSGFLRWLCMKLAKMVNYKPTALFVTFMIVSTVLSMFIASITVILFLAAVTVELAKLLKFDPVPMILSEIFCANLGGAATMCGDPPNIIIGTALGYAFADFLTNTGVMVGICLIVVIAYFYFVYRKELAAANASAKQIDVSSLPKPEDAITSKRDFIVSCVIFACSVIMLMTQAQTGLTVAFIGTFVAVVTLIAFAKDALELLKKVDYETLLFFIGLFVVVGGLEQTGVLVTIANFIGNVSGGNIRLMVAIIIWVSAIASAFVDNVPFAAAMVPVIKSLAATQGADLDTLAWALSMGTDIGGSATPIGASANVVGTSVAAKNGYIIGWGKYCKSAALATVLVIAMSMVMIFIRYC
jgi:Na+/H+ antiporter NhaD/arsenite permease-like protein